MPNDPFIPSPSPLERARSLIAQGELTAARELIGPALGKSPDDPYLRLLQARIEYKDRDHASFISETLVSLQPTYASDELYLELLECVDGVLRENLEAI